VIADRAPAVAPEAAGFWAGCDVGELRIQRCHGCGKVNWFPRTFCFSCSSRDLRWERASGLGAVLEVTTVYRALNESLADEVPYVLAIVRLAEGPCMLTRIVGEGALQAELDAQVEVCFEPTRGHPLPVFRLVRESAISAR